MPIYEFEDEAGAIHEHLFRPSDVPPIGSDIVIDGVRLRRVVSSAIQVSAAVSTVTHGYPYTSLSMPRWTAGCKHTKDGKPIIRSQQHEREVMARTNRERD